MKRFALALVLVLATAAVGMAAERHSGSVLAVDAAGGTLQIRELVEGEGTQTHAVERTLHLAPGTAITLLRPPATFDSAHWPDAWDAQPLALAAIQPGDFVTITTSGNEAVALSV